LARASRLAWLCVAPTTRTAGSRWRAKRTAGKPVTVSVHELCLQHAPSPPFRGVALAAVERIASELASDEGIAGELASDEVPDRHGWFRPTLFIVKLLRSQDGGEVGTVALPCKTSAPLRFRNIGMSPTNETRRASTSSANVAWSVRDVVCG
jgi:hypothetical protein